MKRKQFIQSSGAALLGTILLRNNHLALFDSSIKEHAMGLQLYTFFNSIDNDVEGTLKQIAAVGYKEIESAFSRKGGFYGMKPKEFSKFLKDNGMKWRSHHALGAPFRRPANANPPTGADGKPVTIPPMKNLRDNMQEIVDEVAEGGVEYLVCASTPITTLDEIKSSIEVLNKTDEVCKKTGINFAYHNHDAEFRAVEGQIPYEMFLSQTKMKLELDLAWATKGGKDPVELFKQNPGRFPLWHVKDLDKEFKTVLPVGEGTIDFKRIFAAADTSGMKHFFIEHDMPKDALASIKSSYNYLSKLLGA
jgi:sugar phosphate isomerase/epimerase